MIFLLPKNAHQHWQFCLETENLGKFKILKWDRHLLGKQWRQPKQSATSSENNVDLLFSTS